MSEREDPLARAIALFTGTAAVPNPTLEDRRAAYDQMLAELPVPDGLDMAEERVGGVRCLRVRPTAGRPTASALMLHGGGYVMGTIEGYLGYAGALALASGIEFVVADYRLAPEHPYPAALDDARAAYLALVTERGAEHTAIIGDSGGGGLTTGLLLMLRDEGLPRPAAAVLVSPELDLTASSDSYERNLDRDPVVRRKSVLRNGGMYLAGRDPRATVYASPLWATHEDLPPMLILTTDAESFYDEDVALHRSIVEAGGTADLSIYPDLIHVWPLFWSFLPEGKAAVDEIAAYLAAETGSPIGEHLADSPHRKDVSHGS